MFSSSVFSLCCFSDHDYLHLHVKIDNVTPRGPGPWKFNNSLLANVIFCDFISSRISDLAECVSHFNSVKNWWDFFKESLKQDVISFAKNKRKFACHERVILSNGIIELKRCLVQGDAFLSTGITYLESLLKALVFNKLEGAKIRSKVQWLKNREKPTRYFFKLERQRFEKNNLSSILDEHDNEVFTCEEIERAHVHFYTKLFSEQPIDLDCKQKCFEYFAKTLPHHEQKLCDEPIALVALTDSVKTLNLGKSLGPDGFTVEFFVIFGIS